MLLTHGKTPASSASVIYHGSLLKPEDIAAINAPVMFQQADPALDQQVRACVLWAVPSLRTRLFGACVRALAWQHACPEPGRLVCIVYPAD